MSFFGLETSRNQNTAAPGFSQARDPFAGLSSHNDDGDAIDFEDTYDGLGDQLEEAGDAFNDDTFGGGDVGPVGKDFDFFGATAKVSEAIDEENVRFSRQKPGPKVAAKAPAAPQPTSKSTPHASTSKSYRTGYEKYKVSEPTPELSVNRSLWGMAPEPTPAPSPAPAPASAPAPAFAPTRGRKILSLEEVEAQILASAASKPAAAVAAPPASQAQQYHPGYATDATADHHAAAMGDHPALQLYQQKAPENLQPTQQFAAPRHAGPIKILERPQSSRPSQLSQPSQPSPSMVPSQPQHAHHQQPAQQIRPTQILQNPSRMIEASQSHFMAHHGHNGHNGHNGYNGHHSYNAPNDHNGHPHQPLHRPRGSTGRVPQQILQNPTLHMTEQEKAVYHQQEAKRAKRNQKIHELSKYNGFMKPQDKSFITRIQLLQLVSATGDPAEEGPDMISHHDFYYKVYSQITQGHRQNPGQPLSNFAQTYLYQTGNRQGGMRRHGRLAETHMQRMEQQVQRAVEAAKNKPKHPQLVIAGSLGKISYSNAKTPKPLLNIKRTESIEAQRPASSRRDASRADDKTTLRNTEKIYTLLMELEDHARTMPLPVLNPDEITHARQLEWMTTGEELNTKLWEALKVHEPIGATEVHPFIAILSKDKGKKAIPRVFRHTSHERKTTIMTIIVYHLDQLDVTRGAHGVDGGLQFNAAMREKIELFSNTVMPSLFHHVNETDLSIVDGMLGLIHTRLNVDLVAKTRIGASMLTMILSQAELIKQLGKADAEMWRKWEATFDQFFNVLEPSLPYIFPGNVNTGEDVYVWQLLAAIGVSSTPDHQQRLVLSVKDRVLDTVSHARAMPPEMSRSRLNNVNLFMQSIGLDVDLLQ